MNYERKILWAAWRSRYPESAALEDALYAEGGTGTPTGLALWKQLEEHDAEAMHDWRWIIVFVTRYADAAAGKREAERLDHLCRQRGLFRFFDAQDGRDGIRCTIGIATGDRKAVVGRTGLRIEDLIEAELGLLAHMEGLESSES